MNMGTLFTDPPTWSGPMAAVTKTDLIRDLRDQTQRIASAHRRACKSGPIATGFAALDRLLPSAGLEGGTLVEWLADGTGSGAVTLSLSVAARALDQGGACVVIDSRQEFYPPAAAELGVPLERMVIVRPSGPRLALWAWEQALRFRGVAVTLGEMGPLSDQPFRRLQLAAEAGGGLGFLVRPAACRVEPSWAAVRLGVSAIPSGDLTRRWRVEALHSGAIVELDVGHRCTQMNTDLKSKISYLRSSA
jgi:protein ImuA